jgi:outer membrane protein TolC
MTPPDATISYPAQILCQRPDLRRSFNLLFAQTANVGIAVTDLYPRISFTGFVGLQCAGDTRSTANRNGKHLFSRNSLTFFYGPNFAWPLLNYCRLENRVKEQYALLNEGIALYRNQVLEAFKEVEDALTFYVKSLEETIDLAESFKYAKRSVDISTLQYQEGLADYTKVLNSLQLQVSAEDNLAQAQGNIGLAYATIYRSLGVF